MATNQLDQLLEWDNPGGFCQHWNAQAETIRPAVNYTARRVGVLLARYEETRRGPGVIKLEVVTDHKMPGRVIAEWPWHSDELGPPGAPRWILRGMGPHDMKIGEEHRIVVHTMPGWEVWDDEKQEWKPWEAGAAIQWARKSGAGAYPRGVAQAGYNYRDAKGSWKDDLGADNCFMIETEELQGYMLLIYINPEGAGKVDISPNKGSYDPGEKVTLTAVPANGYSFVSWTGDIAGEAATITVVMDSAKAIMANFKGKGGGDIPIISDIIEWLMSAFESLYEWIMTQLTWLINQIEVLFWSVLNAVLAPIITALDWLQDKILDAWTWITETIPEALNWIKDKLEGAWEWITDKIPELLSSVKDVLDQLWELIMKIKDKIIEFFEDPLAWVTDNILAPMIEPFCAGFERSLEEEGAKEA